jgi:hypothetical protein
MNNPGFVIFFLGFFIALIYSSYTLWTNPEKYLADMKEKRIRFDKSSIGRIFNTKTVNYSKNEGWLEIWINRITFILFYLISILLIYYSIKNK